MDSRLIVGMAAGIAVALAGSAIAFRAMDDSDEFARVLSATPVTESVVVAREECRDEPVTREYKEAGRNIAGTAIGAVVGGVVGNQIGSGSGRKVATAAGAVAGGVVGNRIQDRNRPTRSVTTMGTRCETVNETIEEPAGFDVVYEYAGETGRIRLPNDPGPRLRMATTIAPAVEPQAAPQHP